MQLGKVFFSKIRSRYLKLASIPDGILYFKYLGNLLVHDNNSPPEKIIAHIHKHGKKELALQKEVQREVVTTEEKPKRNIFGIFRKKDEK